MQENRFYIPLSYACLLQITPAEKGTALSVVTVRLLVVVEEKVDWLFSVAFSTLTFTHPQYGVFIS